VLRLFLNVLFCPSLGVVKSLLISTFMSLRCSWTDIIEAVERKLEDTLNVLGESEWPSNVRTETCIREQVTACPSACSQKDS
jgi:hypothetical protein